MAREKHNKANDPKSGARGLEKKGLAEAEKKHDQAKNAHDQAKNAHDQAENAHDEAEKDIEKDPELSDPDPTDDLDEGELAARDNSDEEAFDYLERPRHGGKERGETDD